MAEKQTLPNSTAVLVLGICSIVIGCYGIGIVLGILGIVLSSKGRKLHQEAPDQYQGWGSLNAGFIMSIIGLSLSVIWLIALIFFGLAFLGGALGSHSYSY